MTHHSDPPSQHSTFLSISPDEVLGTVFGRHITYRELSDALDQQVGGERIDVAIRNNPLLAVFHLCAKEGPDSFRSCAEQIFHSLEAIRFDEETGAPLVTQLSKEDMDLLRVVSLVELTHVQHQRQKTFSAGLAGLGTFFGGLKSGAIVDFIHNHPPLSDFIPTFSAHSDNGQHIGAFAVSAALSILAARYVGDKIPVGVDSAQVQSKQMEITLQDFESALVQLAHNLRGTEANRSNSVYGRIQERLKQYGTRRTLPEDHPRRNGWADLGLKGALGGIERVK